MLSVLSIFLIIPVLLMLPPALESWRLRRHWGYQQLFLALIVMAILLLSSRL